MNISLHRKIKLACDITEAILRHWIDGNYSYRLTTDEENRKLAIAVGIVVSEATNVEDLLRSIPVIILAAFPESQHGEMCDKALNAVREVLSHTKY